jgi:DNA helicase-2/ATP-dependent DNA helicase PcrA
MVPSAYQQAIYDFVAHGQGHGVVEAVAGSGKTTTLLGALQRVPEGKRVLFAAFNTAIAEKLKGQVPDHIDVHTSHGFGLSALRKQWPGLRVNDYKYYDIAEQIVCANWLRTATPSRLYMRNTLLDYLRFVQAALVDPRDTPAVAALGARYDLTRQYPQVFQWLVTLVERGYQHTFTANEVSFGDMLWLPNVVPMPIPQYDYVFVDEAQDLSRAQRELLLRACKPGGRMLFVLDSRQAIYGFVGADAESVAALKALPSITELPLSICYRCPTSHLDRARVLVPQIEARPGAPVGELQEIAYPELHARLQPEDMVLCRTNAPLYTLCLELIDRGVPARIQGKDVLKNFADLLGFVAADQKLHGVSATGLQAACAGYLKREQELLADVGNPDLRLDQVVDHIAVIQSIAESRQVYAAKDLKAVLKELSDPHAGNAVRLSSIHRAKGLEAARVFLLFPDLLPHPRAKQDWERQQEYNLLYVALTRATHSLTIVRRQLVDPPEAAGDQGNSEDSLASSF